MIGKRVHVTRYNGAEVDFYSTLEEENKNYYKLTQNSDGHNRILGIAKPHVGTFGKENADYYELIDDTDQVNHPSHYTQGKYEVIDILEQLSSSYKNPTIAYLVSTAGKYLFRAPFKGNMKQDLEKAVWYLNRAIEKLEE